MCGSLSIAFIEALFIPIAGAVFLLEYSLTHRDLTKFRK
jgi:hypothetical protein